MQIQGQRVGMTMGLARSTLGWIEFDSKHTFLNSTWFVAGLILIVPTVGSMGQVEFDNANFLFYNNNNDEEDQVGTSRIKIYL